MQTPKLGSKLFVNNMTTCTLVALSAAKERGNVFIDALHPHNKQVWRYECRVNAIKQGVITKIYYIDNATSVRRIK